MKVTEDMFSSKGQYNKWLRTESFFKALIKLDRSKHFFMVDEEEWSTPFIDGVEMGFISSFSTLFFVGSEHSKNKETGEYDIPYVSITLKELRDRIKVYSKVEVKL